MSNFSYLTSHFVNRCSDLERLDTGDYTPVEYALWLKDMRRIHNFFGELRALKKTLLKEIDNSAIDGVSVLDVGAGNGYVLRELGKQMNGRRAFLTGVEINADAALTIRANEVESVQCDALCLPFADSSFDHAYCTLMLHHFDDEDAVKLLAEMARVVRGKIFVVDLNRDRSAYFMYKLFAPLFLHRLAVEDGALSILRSRTPDELRSLAENAGLGGIEIIHSRLNRLVLSGIGEGNA